MNSGIFRWWLMVWAGALGLVGCSETGGELEVYQVTPSAVRAHTPVDLVVEGDGFVPDVQRSMGCGAPFAVDDGFGVVFEDAAHRAWEGQAVWVDAGHLEVAVEGLPAGVYAVVVTAPGGGESGRLEEALEVRADASGTEADSAQPDTGSDTAQQGGDTHTEVPTTAGDTEVPATAGDTDSSDTDSGVPPCGAGDAHCADDRVLRQCANGIWEEVTCPYYCDAAGARCAGECVPGTSACVDTESVTTCGTDYAWEPATSCTWGCANGGCAVPLGETDIARRRSWPIAVDGRLDEFIWSPTTAVRQVVWGVYRANTWLDVLWDDAYLYVVVQVDDVAAQNDSVSLRNDDSVEIFIDGHNDKGQALASDDLHLGVEYGSSEVVAFWGETTGVTAATVLWEQFWVCEMRIPWDLVGVRPAVGTLVGFNVRVNDDDDGGYAEGAVVWSGDGDADTVPAGWGTIVLTDENGMR